jgi:hypothetical protein
MNDNVINYFMAEYDIRDKANQRSESRKPSKFFYSHFLEWVSNNGSYSYNWLSAALDQTAESGEVRQSFHTC